MTVDPNTFLVDWTRQYVKADRRDRGTVGDTIAQCTQDAGRIGISEHALKKAAGGDLALHFSTALDSRVGRLAMPLH